MSLQTRLVIIVGLSFAGCSPSRDAPDRGQESKVAEAAAPPAADMSDMPGMSMPGMAADSGPMPPMAGMDHAAMGQGSPEPKPGSAPSTAQPVASSMAGMDHAQMPMPAASKTPAPRSGEARTSATSTAPTMPGMDHAAMAGMQMTPSELDQHGSEQLLTLVSELVKDPVVRREIDADPTLREVWADTAVTRIILRTR